MKENRLFGKKSELQIKGEWLLGKRCAAADSKKT